MSVRNGTYDVRESLDDPVVPLVFLQPAAGNDTARDGGGGGRQPRQCAAIADHCDGFALQVGMLRKGSFLEAANGDK